MTESLIWTVIGLLLQAVGVVSTAQEIYILGQLVTAISVEYCFFTLGRAIFYHLRELAFPGVYA